jgi:hypothetical protein
MLLICQQHIIAQSYNLGKQKQSFAYNTLYTNHAQKTPVVKNNNETTTRYTQPIAIETIDTQPTQPMASKEDIQLCKKVHKRIVNFTKYYSGGQVLKKYNNIYKSIPQTQENILNLQKIQYIVISHMNSRGTAFPTLENQLKNASSTEAEIAVFLSCYKE